MANKKKEKEKKDEVKKIYSYYHVLDESNATALALRKITTLYIPAISEMVKLTELSLERKRVQDAYVENRQKIVTGIDESHPVPGKNDSSPKANKKRETRKELLDKKVIELLDQDCGFSIEKKIVLNQSAIEEALKLESAKNPKEVKSICPECGALVNVSDPERNILTAKTLADLTDFVEIKAIEKVKEDK